MTFGMRIPVSGSRIIVTTRSMRVANIVGSHHTHELKGLSDQDSWKLFERMTLEPGQVQLEAHLVEIGKVIVRKCVNVPLAIRVMGSLLQGQSEYTWQNLNHTDLPNMKQDENGGIIPVLKISYDYLPSHLKSCFTYCALYPKDYYIMKEELIYLWMAQGFIMPLDGQSFEDLGEDCFTKLLQRCFFQNVTRDDTSGVIESCKVHDLLHDLATGIAIKSISNGIDSWNDKTRHIFIDGVIDETKNVERYLTKLKRLRTCLRCGSNFIWSYGWFPQMRYLRVLDFANYGHEMKLKKLPSMIGQLVHLRYLDLSFHFMLSAIPNSISQLHNLQTLKLIRCDSLKELPRELSKLVNLRQLEIWGCDNMRYMPPGMDRMTCLHKLSMFALGGRNNATNIASCLGSVGVGKLEDLKYLNNLTGTIEIKMNEGWTFDAAEVKEGGYLINKPRLSDIKIVWKQESSDDDGEVLLQGLQPHSNVRRLSLRHYPGVKFPSWGSGDSLMNLSTPLPNLVELHLDCCTGLKHVPLLSQLRHLKVLELKHLTELEYVECSDSSSSRDGALTASGGTRQGGAHELVFFPSLEKLVVQELPRLKEWQKATSHSESDNGEGETNVGSQDHQLQQQQDKESLVVQFPRLSYLSIESCPDLKTFPLFQKLENWQLHGSNKGLRPFFSRPREIFQHLSSLTIDDDDEIESLSMMDVFQNGCLSSLRRLEFDSCEKLKSISGRGVWEHLTALEYLGLWNLESLEMEDNEGDDTDTPWRCLAPSLHTLYIDYVPIKKLPIGMRHLTALRCFELAYCHYLEEIPGWISCCTSLEIIRTHKCPRVKSLPEEMRHLTSLKELELYECSPELKKRCRKHTGADWHIIQHIPSIRITSTEERKIDIHSCRCDTMGCFR